jgi:hypothetical protein
MATAVITDYNNTKVAKIYPVDYPRIEITPSIHSAVLTDILPFRVKFTAIQIESVSSNFPAIPFQIIGYSNYIL